MNRETETLTLQTDYSFGRITAYPPGACENPQLLDARGTVYVPKGAKLFLDVSQEVCDDLGRIHLVPGRLLANGVSFSEKNLDKAEFRELRPLELSSLGFTSCNGIRIDQLVQLGEMKSLKHLNLSHTPLDILDFSWISQFPNLKTLLLTGIIADDSCLASLTDLRHLEDLHLTHSKISDGGVQAIWRMTNLKALNLGRCPVGDKALEGVGRCSTLRSINLPDTRISDKGIEIIVTEALRNGQDLTSITLRACSITDKALVRLASLKSLTFIDLYDTKVTARGAAFLKTSLPGCRIFVGRDKGGGPKLWKVGDPVGPNGAG